MNFITAAAYYAMYFVAPPSPVFWVLTFIGSMSFYAYMGVHFGAIGDAVDYGEYISGVRCDGFLSSFVSVANKVCGAAVLAALNYAANQQQSGEVLNAINWFVTLIPAIISTVNGFCIYFIPLVRSHIRRLWEN